MDMTVGDAFLGFLNKSSLKDVSGFKRLRSYDLLDGLLKRYGKKKIKERPN
jgi:hypothetical protein